MTAPRLPDHIVQTLGQLRQLITERACDGPDATLPEKHYGRPYGQLDLYGTCARCGEPRGLHGGAKHWGRCPGATTQQLYKVSEADRLAVSE